MKQAFDKNDISQRQDRLLTTLEGLLELSATDVKATLNQATSLIAEVLAADKVDVFFHDWASETLVALGTSDTAMGRKQARHRVGPTAACQPWTHRRGLPHGYVLPHPSC